MKERKEAGDRRSTVVLYNEAHSEPSGEDSEAITSGKITCSSYIVTDPLHAVIFKRHLKVINFSKKQLRNFLSITTAVCKTNADSSL